MSVSGLFVRLRRCCFPAFLRNASRSTPRFVERRDAGHRFGRGSCGDDLHASHMLGVADGGAVGVRSSSACGRVRGLLSDTWFLCFDEGSTLVSGASFRHACATCATTRARLAGVPDAHGAAARETTTAQPTHRLRSPCRLRSKCRLRSPLGRRSWCIGAHRLAAACRMIAVARAPGIAPSQRVAAASRSPNTPQRTVAAH